MNNNKRQKAILYVRVSTDEQAERGHSLANQEEKLRSYCAQHGIDIAGFYREDHSAKTFERPQFTLMLESMRKNKGSANLLLFLKWDRFSRNAPEAYGMIHALKKLGVEPQAIEQPLNLEIPENKIMLAIYLTSGEVENDRRSLNTIAGMRRAMKEGRWMCGAPKGYRNSRDQDNKPCIVPGKDADTIRWAFGRIATGSYHIAEVWKMAKEKGLKTCRNGFFHIVRNPVYMGKVAIQAYKDEPAMLVDGKHEPLISARLFYEVQEVLDGKKKPRIPARANKLEEIPLRGFLLCPKCERVLTGSGSKGNGGTYFYYHCTGGCKERVKASIVNDAFLGMLRSITINEGALKIFELALADACASSREDTEKEQVKVAGEIETYKKRLSHIQTLMMDGELEPADYRAMKAKLEPEIARLERQMGWAFRWGR
jgi:DNA invertase Pin-like site-specific DNA recombinase